MSDIVIEEADCALCARHSRAAEVRRCPVCGRSVGLTVSGHFRTHPRRGPRCAGVGAHHPAQTIVSGAFAGAPTGYRLTEGCEATHGRGWRLIPPTDPRHAGLVAAFLDLVAKRGAP